MSDETENGDGADNAGTITPEGLRIERTQSKIARATIDNIEEIIDTYDPQLVQRRVDGEAQAFYTDIKKLVDPFYDRILSFYKTATQVVLFSIVWAIFLIIVCPYLDVPFSMFLAAVFVPQLLTALLFQLRRRDHLQQDFTNLRNAMKLLVSPKLSDLHITSVGSAAALNNDRAKESCVALYDLLQVRMRGFMIWRRVRLRRLLFDIDLEDDLPLWYIIAFVLPLLIFIIALAFYLGASFQSLGNELTSAAKFLGPMVRNWELTLVAVAAVITAYIPFFVARSIGKEIESVIREVLDLKQYRVNQAARTPRLDDYTLEAATYDASQEILLRHMDLVSRFEQLSEVIGQYPALQRFAAPRVPQPTPGRSGGGRSGRSDEDEFAGPDNEDDDDRL